LSDSDAVLELHYRDRSRCDAAVGLARRAIVIGDARPSVRPVLVGEVL
jgi:hypothetical protein